jgi:transposase
MDAPTRDGINVPKCSCESTTSQTGAPIMKATTIGIDLAKNVFQVHGVSEHGKVVLKNQIKRVVTGNFETERKHPCVDVG